MRRAFELSACGLSDREVASAVGLRLTHVRKVLRNPVYHGRLRTGEASGAPALVTREVWGQCAVVRTRYARRHRGPISQRTYALATILVCASCGRRLTGHVGRYRHVDACPEFKAARPVATPWKSPGDARIKGESYKAAVYDDLVPQLLERVSLRADTMTKVVAGLVAYPDITFTLARIERERELATARYLRDRDVAALQQRMSDLDADEDAAKSATQQVDPSDAKKWLRDLPALWRAADDTGRRLLTEALFERVEVLGVREAKVYPTPEADAHGWSEVLGSAPLLLNAGRAFSTDGRGERGCPATNDLPVAMRLAEPPEACEWLRSA